MTDFEPDRDATCAHCRRGYRFAYAATRFKAATNYLRLVSGTPWRRYCSPSCQRRARRNAAAPPVPPATIIPV